MIEAIVSLSHCLIGVPAEIRIFFPAQLGIVSLSHCLTGVPAEIRIFFPPNWGLSHCLIVSPRSRQRSGFFSRPTGDCLIVSLSQLGFLRSIPHRIASRASHPEHRIQSIASHRIQSIASRASHPEHRIASHPEHRIQSIASHRIQSIASRASHPEHRIASHRIASHPEHRRTSHPEHRRRHPLAQRRALAGQPSRARGSKGFGRRGVRALGTTGNKTHTGHSKGSLVGIRVLGVRAQGVRALGTTGARVVTLRPGKSSRPGQGGCERLQKKQRTKSPAS